MATGFPLLPSVTALTLPQSLIINYSHFQSFNILVCLPRPVYVDDFSIQYSTSIGSVTLIEGVDFIFNTPFIAAVRVNGKAIYASILLHKKYEGYSVTINYKPIEEQYSLVSTEVRDYLITQTDRLYEITYDEICEGKIDYALKDHYEDYQEFYEKDTYELELHLIAQAISQDNNTSTKLSNYLDNMPLVVSTNNNSINSKILRSGSILTGPLTVNAQASQPNDAVNLNDLNNAIALANTTLSNKVAQLTQYVNKTSDTLSAPLVLTRDPIANNEIATKNYIDTHLSTVPSENLPTGAIVLAKKDSTLDGFLKCNGAHVDKASYSNLYNVVKDQFSIVDMSHQFKSWQYQHSFNKIGVPDFSEIKSFELLKHEDSANNLIYLVNPSYNQSVITNNSIYYTPYPIYQTLSSNLDVTTLQDYTDLATVKFNINDRGFVTDSELLPYTNQSAYFYTGQNFLLKNKLYFINNNTQLWVIDILPDGQLSSPSYLRDFPLTSNGTYTFNYVITHRYVYFFGFDAINPAVGGPSHRTVPKSYYCEYDENGNLGPLIETDILDFSLRFDSIYVIGDTVYADLSHYTQPYYNSWNPNILTAKILPNGKITKFSFSYKYQNAAYYKVITVNNKWYRFEINENVFPQCILKITERNINPDNTLSNVTNTYSLNLTSYVQSEQIRQNFFNQYTVDTPYFYISNVFITSSKIYVTIEEQLYSLPDYNEYIILTYMVSFDLNGGFNDYLNYTLPHLFTDKYYNFTPWNNQTVIDNTTVQDVDFQTVNTVIDTYDGIGDFAFYLATKNKVYIYGVRKYDSINNVTIYRNYYSNINTDGSLTTMTEFTATELTTSNFSTAQAFIYKDQAYVFATEYDPNTLSTNFNLYKAPIDQNGNIGVYSSVVTIGYSAPNLTFPDLSFIYNDCLYSITNYPDVQHYSFYRINLKDYYYYPSFGPLDFASLQEIPVALTTVNDRVYIATNNSSTQEIKIYSFIMTELYSSTISLTDHGVIFNNSHGTIVTRPYASSLLTTSNAIYFIGSDEDTLISNVNSTIYKVTINANNTLGSPVLVSTLPVGIKKPLLVTTSTRLYIIPGLASNNVDYNGIYNTYYYINTNLGRTSYLHDVIDEGIMPGIEKPIFEDPNKFYLPNLEDEGELSYFIKT